MIYITVCEVNMKFRGKFCLSLFIVAVSYVSSFIYVASCIKDLMDYTCRKQFQSISSSTEDSQFRM